MTLTVTELKALTLSEDLTGIISDITDDQFVALLNQALILKQTEIKKDVPAAFEKTTTLVMGGGGYELTIPADIDPDKTKNSMLFWDTTRPRSSIVSRSVYRRFGNTLRFGGMQTVGAQFGFEYRSYINTYVSTTMGASVAETEHPRASMYIRNEIRKLFYDSLQQNEQSAAGINYGGISNRIS